MPRSALLALFSALLLGGVPSCGDDGSTDPVDPDLEPLVGLWTATSLVHTSAADPGKSTDLVDDGADFTLRIEENGRYRTVLRFGLSASEEGRLEVEGQTLLFHPDGTDRVDPATFQLAGDELVLEASSEFNFGDGEGTVPTTVRIELTR